MSSNNLILVRDSSPLRLVFDDDARRGGLPASDLTNLCFLRSGSSVRQTSVVVTSMHLAATDVTTLGSDGSTSLGSRHTVCSTTLNIWETRQCRPATFVDGCHLPLDHHMASAVDSIY